MRKDRIFQSLKRRCTLYIVQYLLMCKKRIFHCAEVRCFSACANVQEMIFYCTKRRCFCTCAKRGYFIVPRGDFSAHAQREDISLCQEEMFQRMCKERIAPRGDASAHAQREEISLRQEEMFQRMCKERIAPRGDVSAHAQREDILLRQEEMFQRICKERIFHCTKMRCICSCAKR